MSGAEVTARLKRWVVWTPAARKLNGRRCWQGRRRAAKKAGVA
jgi:hypothetical protein